MTSAVKRALLAAVLAGAVAAAVVMGRRHEDELSQHVADLNRQGLEHAVELAEVGLQEMLHAGDRCAPSRVVSRFVKLNAAGQVVTPEQSARMRQAGAQIEYHEAQVVGPWQVALVPDESRHAIRIEGYATELSTPVIVKDVPCP